LNISSLDLPEKSIEFLHDQGFKTLYPPQTECIKNGLLENNNLIVSTPTASGKTLVAIISTLQHIQNEGKIIYLSPLRALASEKYSDFKKLESLSKPDGTSIKVSISTGDFESNSEYLKNSDIIILTNEKFDSLQRHGIKWISKVSLIVIDEIHLIGDSYRGPTLEMIISNMLISEHSPQILGLSATINNVDEISSWINAKSVISTWRPVDLSEGVFCFGQIDFKDGNSPINIDNSGVGTAIDIAIDMVKQNGQSIIFTETRKRASSMAKKIEKMMPLILNSEQSKELSDLSQLLDKNENSTDMNKLLVSLIKHGVAFHHAGVSNQQRQIIESGFRDRKIKIICATPTLAAGVNLPARRVILSSYLRYDMQYGGMSPISVLDYKQMCGRAGRPQYDDKGETILIANNESEQDSLFDHYINGDVEDIESALSNEDSLRTHILATICSSKFGISKPNLLKLFNNTLYTLQNGNDELEFKVEDCIDFLMEENFIEKRNNKFISTRFGKQTSLLYINPTTARDFRDSILSSHKDHDYTMGILQVIASSSDFGRLFSIRKSDETNYLLFISKHKSEFFDIGHSDHEFRSTFRILAALNAWINEKKENDILNFVDIDPGDLYFATENTKWLLNAFYRLTLLFQTRHLLDHVLVLQNRIQQGIKSELIELTSLKGIGRVYARRLFDSGFTSLNSLNSASISDISKVPQINSSLAEKIKEQLKDFEHNDSNIS
tara:strand:- start:63487 stop:65661 length:2175 start_codon:yes stop_codon:yes gene_type:complete